WLEERGPLEESRDLVAAPEGAAGRDPAVVGRFVLPRLVGEDIAAGVADGDVASRNKRFPEGGEDAAGVAAVGDEVQHRPEYERDGLVEVEDPAGLGVAEDGVGVAEVGVNDRGVGVAMQDELAVGDGDIVVVDVDDAGSK